MYFAKGTQMKKTLFMLIILTFFNVASISATTWGTESIKCPVCSQDNDFEVVYSYGTYIYSWPSKYQDIYWPFTESQTVYSCKKCKYSAFMTDYRNISGDTLKLILNSIDTMQIDLVQKSDYQDIPIIERLKIAEQFYQIYEHSPYFWCHFYRVMAYFYDFDQNKVMAEMYRRKALLSVEEMLSINENEDYFKYYTYIKASLYYYLFQDNLAVEEFKKVKELKYINSEVDVNLNKSAEDFIKKIKNKAIVRFIGNNYEEFLKFYVK